MIGTHSPRRAPIAAHIERHIGPIKQAFGTASAGGEDSSIEVLHVAATPERPIHTLITSGMSDRPMAVPQGTDSPHHLELMMTLPRQWLLDAHAPRDAKRYWPIAQLLRLATIPSQSGTWLGWGHTLPNGDPPQPLAPDTKLCGAILVPSLLVPTAFYELTLEDRSIAFYSVVPLYREELALKEREGMKVLFEKLLDHDIRDLVDPRRRNVATRRFGLFW